LIKRWLHRLEELLQSSNGPERNQSDHLGMGILKGKDKHKYAFFPIILNPNKLKTHPSKEKMNKVTKKLRIYNLTVEIFTI